MLKRCSILLVATLLAACGRATTFDQFSLEEGLSARMDASQRVVLVSNRGGKDGTRHVVCAEPSPDSIISASTAIAAAADATGYADGEQTAALKASLALTSAQNAAFVGMRTQTIQLLRDGLYRACEAYMNGAIDEAEYNMLLISMPRVMTALIAIDGLTSRPAAPPVALAAPAISASATTVAGTGTTPEGKAAVINIESVTLPQPKPDTAQAAAVQDIARRVIDTPTTPAICLSLLSRNAKDAIPHDEGYRAVVAFCKASFGASVARMRR